MFNKRIIKINKIQFHIRLFEKLNFQFYERVEIKNCLIYKSK